MKVLISSNYIFEDIIFSSEMEPERHHRNMMLAMAEYAREPRAKSREVQFLLDTFGARDQADLSDLIAQGLPSSASEVVYDFRRDILAEAEGKSFDKGGLEFMNFLVSHVAERVAMVAASLSSHYGKAVLSSEAFYTTVKLLFPEEIAKLAWHSVTNAVTKCSSRWNEKEGEFCPSELSNVKFSSSTTAGILEEVWEKNIDPYCPITLAAILNYLTVEILSLCSNFITEQELRGILENDPELRLSFSS